MGGFEFPEPKKEFLLEENAVLSEYRILKEAGEKVTILTLGPLTNIALLIQTFPEVKEKLRKLL